MEEADKHKRKKLDRTLVNGSAQEKGKVQRLKQFLASLMTLSLSCFLIKFYFPTIVAFLFCWSCASLLVVYLIKTCFLL